jgi:mono/diheme cytochrome c family protein
MRNTLYRVFAASLAMAAVLAPAACAQTAPVVPPVIGQAGSPAAGRVYAEENCASCHAIDAGEIFSPLPEAPPFKELAETPGMTGLALHVWLQSPHETMPHIIVDPDHVEDVWSYMRSLQADD